MAGFDALPDMREVVEGVPGQQDAGSAPPPPPPPPGGGGGVGWGVGGPPAQGAPPAEGGLTAAVWACQNQSVARAGARPFALTRRTACPLMPSCRWARRW